MKWTSVKDELPEEEAEENTLWFDVWAEGDREVDAKFYKGEFFRQCLDYHGDYSHAELIHDVTHWCKITYPAMELGE